MDKMQSINTIDFKNISEMIKDRQILRTVIIAELDTINLYERLLTHAKDERIKELLRLISREEKRHVAQLNTILLKFDEKQLTELEEGMKEVQQIM
jgi:rubrerythrin